MPIRGSISLPGDKSISHRGLMLAALADGECVIHNLSTGEDVESTRNCLLNCGVLSRKENGVVYISGGEFKNPDSPLDCGNSGTTTRLISGLLAGQGVSAQLVGDASLSSRPMGRIIVPLTEMGAEILSTDGKLPLTISSRSLNGSEYTLPVASAQVKSSIILAALGAVGKTKIIEPVKTRDHSEIMLESLGAEISVKKNEIMILPLKDKLNSFELTVPGDPSSAAFFAAAAAMIPNSDLTIRNISANPTRIGFFHALEQMGGGVIWKNLHHECGELVGDVQIYYQPLHGISIFENQIPSLIDELPIIAVLASTADSPTVVEGAEELRVKETDRINAICKNLSAMGVEVIEKKDGFIIDAPNILQSASIESFNDHRIAMAFTIAGLNAGSYNKIDNMDCVNISFPEFLETLKSIIK
ncbi:MAG: 3-phosphoshikimate 1-carboxyvinyltransferase [Candidatus Marinimicrobia bacterium]|nr:3-phosphoshikimate 1-carboxyvinyltransferase [Candidatus Neomarinimicrobiota bacterium]